MLTVTGHGLKDPQWALKAADGARRHADASPVDAAEIAERARPRAAGVEREAVRRPHASRSRCPRPRRTSAPASTRSASRSRSTTSSRSPRAPSPACASTCTASARARCPPTRRTSSCARSPHTFAAVGQPTARPRTWSRATPSRTAAASGSSGAAIVSGIMAAKGLLEGVVELDADRAARARHRAGGPPRQRRAGALRRPHHRVDDAGRARSTRSCSCTAASRRSCRARAHHVDRARAQPAAGVACRTRTRSSTCRARRCSSRRSSRARSCCSPRPRTACTRATGRARCPRPTRSSACCAPTGLAAVVSGAGPSILVLGSDPVAAAARRRAGRPNTRSRPGERSCWPSTSKVLQWCRTRERPPDGLARTPHPGCISTRHSPTACSRGSSTATRPATVAECSRTPDASLRPGRKDDSST